MKKITLIMAMAAMFAACQQEELAPDLPEASADDYVATVEDFGAATKTSMSETNRIVWNAGDELMIFQGYTLGDRYKVSDASAGTSNGTFSIVRGEDGRTDGDFIAGTELSRNVAVYPFSEDIVIDNLIDGDTDEVLAYTLEGIEIPAVQTYVENSFANGAFPMVAVTVDKPDHRLKFNNVAGALKLRLKGSDKIKSIKVEGNNDEKLSGKATVTAWFEDGKKPTLEMASDAGTSVTLDCGDGVQLSITEATSFVIALPPTEFTEGFTLTITDTEGNVETKTAKAANTVKRSGILAMPEIYLGYVVLDKYICSHSNPGGVYYDNGAVCVFLGDASLEGMGGIITSGSGNYLKFDVYSENGELSPGTYYPCEESGAIREGTFAVGWDATEIYGDMYDDFYVNYEELLQNWGTCWMNMGEDGHETGQHISDGKLTIEKDGDEYLITIESSVINAVYQGPIGDSEDSDIDYVDVDKVIYSTSYTGLATLYLGDDDVSYSNGWISGEGNYLKLEFYSEDGTFVPGVYYPSTEGGRVTEGTFGIGYDINLEDLGFCPNFGTCWMTRTSDGSESGQHIVDGILTVEKSGDIYSITLQSSTINVRYEGRLVTLDISLITLIPNTVYDLSDNITGVMSSLLNMEWSSDNSSVATVDSYGNVTAVSAGETYVRATLSNSNVSCKVIVKELIVEAVPTARYVDEFNVDHGLGIAIGDVVWAPVNCGYHETDYPYGKLYQWGRKYGQGYSEEQYSDVSVPEFAQGGITVAEGQSEDNYNVFFIGSDWIDQHDESLWNSGTEETPIKNTDNDPCPSGWRVPTYNELNALSQNYSLWVTNDNGQSGCYLTGEFSYTDGVPKVFFPAAGYRFYDGSAAGRGLEGRYYTSDTTDSFACDLWLCNNDYWGYSYNVAMGNNWRGNAYSVRCVQE